MAYFLRKKITGNVYVNEETSGVFEYKWADTVETGWEEAHTVGDTNTQAECEARWGIIAVDETLSAYKKAKNLQIDIKTQTLISSGFTFDSETFSTSIPAQINWSSIKENKSDYTFPLGITTKADGEYQLAEVDVDAFWTAGKDFVLGHLDSGRALKVQVNAAIDKTAVDAIIDNR